MSALPPKADINGRIFDVRCATGFRRCMSGSKFFTLAVRGSTHHIPSDPHPRGWGSHLIETWTGAKSRIGMDDVKDGQCINCNSVHGTVIGKRSTRNQRFVLAKMDNGFTLKLNADTVSVELSDTLRQRREENFSGSPVTGISTSAISSEAVS